MRIDMKRVEHLRRLVMESLPLEALRSGDVDVYLAPSDEEVKASIMHVLYHTPCPVAWRELVEAYRGAVGESRLRKLLYELSHNGQILMLPHARYCHPLRAGDYIDVALNKYIVMRIWREVLSNVGGSH